MIGFLFETVGDAQLAAFKRGPENKGKVMDVGLWRFTRHPNYFGDACVWVGPVPDRVGNRRRRLVGGEPVLIIFLLTRWSGVPTTEGRMRRTKSTRSERSTSTVKST